MVANQKILEMKNSKWKKNKNEWIHESIGFCVDIGSYLMYLDIDALLKSIDAKNFDLITSIMDQILSALTDWCNRSKISDFIVSIDWEITRTSLSNDHFNSITHGQWNTLHGM